MKYVFLSKNHSSSSSLEFDSKTFPDIKILKIPYPWISEFIKTEEMLEGYQGDPRWQRSDWRLHWPPSGTNQELQLNYGEIIQNKQLNNSGRGALYPWTDRRISFTTWLVQSTEETQEEWLGSHRWHLNWRRNISMARGFFLRTVGSKSQVGMPT